MTWFMLVERRHYKRTRTLKRGRIMFNDGRSAIDCRVTNLSEAGALLRVGSIIGIPDTFDLHLEDKIYFAWIVWKSRDRVGVTWTPSSTQKDLAPQDHDSSAR